MSNLDFNDLIPAQKPMDSAPNQSGFDDLVPQNAAQAPKQPQTWGQAAATGVSNIPSSAAKFATDIVQPILHPIDTAVALKNIGHGLIEKTGLTGSREHEKYPDAVGQFFAERYGGMENLKKTMAEDPVGFAADISTVLTGGGSLAARAPGVLGKVGEITRTAGNITNPLTPVIKGGQAVGNAVAGTIGNLGTHTGGESLKIAAKAGLEGGKAGETFLENMRGTAPLEDTVNAARSALGKMREERSTAYKSGMKSVADPAVLDFVKIDDAFDKVSRIKNFKGQDLSPTTANIRQELQSTLDGWRSLDPREFHTVEGLDALKQKIGDIRDGAKYGTPERAMADRVYHGVRQTIVEQAPAYAKVMKGYEEASKQLKDIEKTLSLNPNAAVDTSLRKLQSVLRNNVTTNYGRRADLADYLVKAGAPHLMERLAGQTLNTWTPRGLGKLGMQLATEMGLIAAGTTAAGFPGLALAGATLPMMSPRLMGEAAYKAGQIARPFKGVPMRDVSAPIYQAGRSVPLGHGPFNFPALQGPAMGRAEEEKP